MMQSNIFEHRRYVNCSLNFDTFKFRHFWIRLIGSKILSQNIFFQYWCAEKQVETTMKLQQLFGGYGYMTEYPIANLFAGARVQTIYGGTTEIMKELIARTI